MFHSQLDTSNLTDVDAQLVELKKSQAKIVLLYATAAEARTIFEVEKSVWNAASGKGCAAKLCNWSGRRISQSHRLVTPPFPRITLHSHKNNVLQGQCVQSSAQIVLLDPAFGNGPFWEARPYISILLLFSESHSIRTYVRKVSLDRDAVRSRNADLCYGPYAARNVVCELSYR